jgi:hypothetical protein
MWGAVTCLQRFAAALQVHIESVLFVAPLILNRRLAKLSWRFSIPWAEKP